MSEQTQHPANQPLFVASDGSFRLKKKHGDLQLGERYTDIPFVYSAVHGSVIRPFSLKKKKRLTVLQK